MRIFCMGESQEAGETERGTGTGKNEGGQRENQDGVDFGSCHFLPGTSELSLQMAEGGTFIPRLSLVACQTSVCWNRLFPGGFRGTGTQWVFLCLILSLLDLPMAPCFHTLISPVSRPLLPPGLVLLSVHQFLVSFPVSFPRLSVTSSWILF